MAVDGSQLLPWRDASLPVALVQAGTFENPHQPPTPYLKEVDTELLLPDDLGAGEAEAAEARAGAALGYSRARSSTSSVSSWRRVPLSHGWSIMRGRHATTVRWKVVAFCDGSLIVSFAVKMQPVYRKRYVDAARELLAVSEACRVPLIGYIDTSYARDIVTMLGSLDDGRGEGSLREGRGIGDALLWQGRWPGATVRRPSSRRATIWRARTMARPRRSPSSTSRRRWIARLRASNSRAGCSRPGSSTR